MNTRISSGKHKELRRGTASDNDRKIYFHFIPLSSSLLTQVTMPAASVYGYIFLSSLKNEGYCKMNTMGKILTLPFIKVRRSIQELCEKGFIEVKRTSGKPSLYILLKDVYGKVLNPAHCEPTNDADSAHSGHTDPDHLEQATLLTLSRPKNPKIHSKKQNPLQLRI